MLHRVRGARAEGGQVGSPVVLIGNVDIASGKIDCRVRTLVLTKVARCWGDYERPSTSGVTRVRSDVTGEHIDTVTRREVCKRHVQSTAYRIDRHEVFVLEVKADICCKDGGGWIATDSAARAHFARGECYEQTEITIGERCCAKQTALVAGRCPPRC